MMGLVTYESEHLKLGELEIWVEVDQKDSPYRKKNANIMICQEDLNFTHISPDQLKKIGKFLIEQADYIDSNFDKKGNRKEVSNA